MCAQVERQIEQMVKFIRQEAEEKANEIRVSAEEASAVQGSHGGWPGCGEVLHC